MAKLNIADKMTMIYNEIQQEKDLGRKLFALEDLEDKLDGLLRGEKFASPGAWGKIVSWAAGITTIATPFVGGISMAVVGDAAQDTFLFASGAVVATIGTLGGVIFTTEKADNIMDNIDEKVRNKRAKKNKVEYLNKVAPYHANLQSLRDLVSDAKKDILETDKKFELRESSQLGALLERYPSLMTEFKKTTGPGAQTIQPVGVNPSEPGQDKSLSL